MTYDRVAKVAANWIGSKYSFAAHLIFQAACLAMIPIWGVATTLLILTTALTVTTELIAVLLSNQQTQDTAEIRAYLHQLAEDIKEVDERHAEQRIEDEKL